MKKDPSGRQKFVKFETAMISALIALVIGFIGGIVFSAFKMEAAPEETSMMANTGGVTTQTELTPEQAEDVAALERAAKSSPENPEAWIALGNSCFDFGLTEKAIQAYETALKYDPNNADVWTDMGVMYRRNGNSEQAVASFERAQMADPGHEVSLFNKGLVLMHDLNDMEGAMAAWEELLKINPAAATPGGMPIKDLVEKMRSQL